MKHWRSNVVVLILFLLGAIIIGRLVFLQVLNEGFYKALAQGQQNLSSLAKGDRGTVFLQDRNGNLYTLAANQKVPYAFASPAEIENPKETSIVIASILDLKEEEVFPKLKKEESLFELLKKKVTEEEQTALKELAIPGIYVGKEEVRAYPQETLAAHVIGFANQDGQGQYGIEEELNKVLTGQEGLRSDAKNPASYLLAAFHKPIQDGSDVVLTIDYNIQAVAESLLQEAKEDFAIEEGTIIVIEPTTGKVLAMANWPAFNPNEYSEVENISVFQNPAIQKIYEPGSIFKPLTMAAAIDVGAVTPNTTYTDHGIVQIGGRKVYNYGQRTWGQRSMTEVLEYSINTGVVFAERQTGHDAFVKYVKDFGIFEPTGLTLAGEVHSSNSEFQKGYEINFATASFGQGIEMTPMQIVRAFSALANNGVMTSPYIIEGTEHAEDNKTIISPKTASQITEMLTSVVEHGYASTAQIPGYHVAGKTGTAQISWSALGIGKSGYSDKTIQSFIGYAPAFEPKFLALVKLNNPAINTAEYSATPIFQKLAKYIIDYYQIPPDYDIE